MNKTELWTKAQRLLNEHNADEKLIADLAELLKPKTSGGSVKHPPIERDGELYYYCRYTDRYWTSDDSVKLHSKPVYSKLGARLKSKAHNEIKQLEAEELALLRISEKEKACTLSYNDRVNDLNSLIETIKANRNKPSFLLARYSGIYEDLELDAAIEVEEA
jgi:alpha-galactosidase/6-phospho-beta-glucosidase family protein